MTVLGKRVEVTLDNILFATDFSPVAQKAGRYAEAIAQHYKSTIHLAHIIDLSSISQMPDLGICIDALRKNGEASLENARAQFASANIQVTTTLEEVFDPAKAILEIANERSANLIVCGTRGHQGLARLAIGSFAEQLIHRAECPVLTIGPQVTPPHTSGMFERIVYATDFSPEAAKAATFASSFAQDCGAHIYLCHVLSQADYGHGVDGQELTNRFTSALQRIVPDIAQEWCEPECIVEHSYAPDGILLLAHRVNADLIVLGTRRFSHWFDSVKAGIAYQVISAATCPVLTVRG